MAEQIPRRLKRLQSAEQQPAQPEAGGAEEEEEFGGQPEAEEKKKGGLFAGLFARKPRAVAGAAEEKKPALYYEPAQRAGRAGRAERAEGEEEVAKSLYEQLQKERELRKETARLALNEIKEFRQKHMRMPEENEYDEIAENIYEQIKEQYEKAAAEAKAVRAAAAPPAAAERVAERRALRRRGAEAEKGARKEEAAPQAQAAAGREKLAVEVKAEAVPQKKPLPEPEKEFSVESLFGEEESLNLDELAEPSDEGAERELKLLGLEDELDTVSEEFETSKNKCPTCGTRTEDLVFCSQCGAGFCTHCALKAEVLGDRIKYTCPACKGEVSTKKASREL